MSFSFITDDGVVTWDDGDVTGVPARTALDAEIALRERMTWAATPTGPFYPAGSPEGAYLAFRSLWPDGEVVGDVPVIPEQEDELDWREPLQEAASNFAERLHPRDRLGRWRHVLSMAKPSYSDTVAPGVYYKETHKVEATNDQHGKHGVIVGPKFFDLKPEQRRMVLAHEIGHDYDHALMTDEATAWVWDEDAWKDDAGVPLNGPGARPAERIADAIGALLTDDEETIKRWPAIKRLDAALKRLIGEGSADEVVEPKDWQVPPPPVGKKGESKGGKGYSSDEAYGTNTALGHVAEEAFVKILDGGRILHPEGKGAQSPLDVHFDGYGFEVKGNSTRSLAYKATPKKFEIEEKQAAAEQLGLTPALAIVVIDSDAGMAHAYYREGLKGGRLSEATGWKYLGQTKLDSPQQVEKAHESAEI